MLKSYGYEVKAVCDGKQAMDIFLEDKYDLVVTDLKMPNADGLEVLAFVKEVMPESIVIIITGYGTVHSAVEAMRLGAFDYITKPLKDDLVKLTLERALNFAKLKEENISLKGQLKRKYDFGKIIGYSDSMRKVFERIEKVASHGQHRDRLRRVRDGQGACGKGDPFQQRPEQLPLVPVNCGAIPEELLESELFGHEKGAFTGAIKSRVGRFELAHGGTIFLDEIGDMSPALQVKVLRVIQEKQFERIGGVKTLSVDVRIIAATNQDLDRAVQEKRFREDLFYRINVIPSTFRRSRTKNGYTVLINHFMRKFNKLKKRNVKGLSQEAMQYMMKYHWPGMSGNWKTSSRCSWS